MMTMEERYVRLAKDTRTVLRAMRKAVTEGEGKFESDRDIFYVCALCGEFILHKADQLSGGIRLFQSDDFKLFLMTCLSYLEGEEI